MRVNLDGRRFVMVGNDPPGDAAAGEAVFPFAQEGDVFRASYRGGRIAGGVLIGRIEGDLGHLWFQQLTSDGAYHAGEGEPVFETRNDGRLCIRERWRFTHGAVGGGLAVFEEEP